MINTAAVSHQDTPALRHTCSPVDGSVIASVSLHSLRDVDRSLDIANRAQQHWQQMPLSLRQQFCRDAIRALLEHREMIACEISWMMGRPIRFSSNELRAVESRTQRIITQSEQALAPMTQSRTNGVSRYITRAPIGTVLVISPWNYPYLTAINAIIPALLAGNSVILKHSSQTPLCAERLQQAFKTAKLPAGVFQYLHLDHPTTHRLVASERLHHVSFTGSVAGGAMIEQAAAGHFHSIGLGLGGKDPAYVRADANLDHAVATIVNSAFYNSGQSCCAIERVYVDSRVHDLFVAKARNLINRYRLGSPLDDATTLGPMISTSAADFVREQIREAIDQGAKAHIVESNFPMSREGTPYLAPQLLSDVTHHMRVMTEETFGPVLPVQKVGSDEEAISLMNDSEYGLTASVFSSDVQKATGIGTHLDTGTFCVNRCDTLDPAQAWSGVKHSGRGCALTDPGFSNLTRPKAFCINHV
ncbi:aldehyde dehydrogenase family protein [Photobacterium sp. GSS17]|uniref:aldehyde dehydrogenase family protein n=1 Tax=Photobacterium sp. GSS17 TaxID=3020715 RepID=UPI002360F4DE|nr:aldehyde dehydrogenase family protein [Photobacterium sp. GSS17]